MTTRINSLDDILSSYELSSREILLSNQICAVLENKCPGPYNVLSDLFKTICEYAAFGKRISDLPNRHDVIDDTKFLVSRDGESYSVTYGQLLSCSFKDMLAGMRVGSMAFEESWKYSLSDHNHGNDYLCTTISVNNIDTPRQKIMSISVGLVGEETLDGCQIFDIYAPDITFDDPPTPEIGTLRFIYLKNDTQCMTNAELISSGGYDGWVWPDGSSLNGINKKRFKNAISVYGDGSSSIKIPNLSGMFRPMPHSVHNVEHAIAQHVSCPKHKHAIGRLTVAGKAKTAGTVWESYDETCCNHAKFNNADTKGNIHNGVNSGKTAEASFEHDVRNGPYFENLKVEDFVPAGKYMPQRLYMPVQIYIGGEKNAWRNEWQLTFQLNVNGRRTDLAVYYVGENYVRNERGEEIDILHYPNVQQYHGFDIVWQEQPNYDGMTKDEVIEAITYDTVVTCHYEPNSDYEWDIPVDYDYALDENGISSEISDLTAINVDDPTTPQYMETLGLSSVTSNTDELSGLITI